MFLSIISADKSATNKFGTFTMRYDLRNKQANNSGFSSCKFANKQGYLNVDNTTIQYREDECKVRIE